MKGWLHTALLSCKIVGDPDSRPSWRENISERFWYQLRETRLYRNMTQGPHSESLEEIEVLGVSTTKEEILEDARTIVVLHNEGVTVLYAKNAQEAERWREAFKDAAADEHRIPVDEEGLKLWLMSAASEVKETGDVPDWCLQAMDEERCGIERMVKKAEGATMLHLACCYTGNCLKLLQAICQRSEIVRKSADDGGSLPIHTLLTFSPEFPASVKWMAQECKEDLLKTDNGGMTPLHRLVRWFKPEEANRCTDSLLKLVDACPEACEKGDDRGRLPAHLFARYYADLLHPLRLLVWKHPPAASAATAQGWLPLHYVARYHGQCTDAFRFLLGMAPSTLYARTGSGWLAVHHVCRYGASSQSLSLLLVPATSLSTTPNGYTPLHLLARYQASDVNILKHCLDLQPEAVTVACRDGMLPLHLIVAYQGSCDASIRLILNAYPQAAVAPSGSGVIPLQLVTSDSQMSWGTRRMLEGASLEVQEMNEKGLVRAVRKEVLYDPRRDAIEFGAANHRAGDVSVEKKAAPRPKSAGESLGVRSDWWKRDGEALRGSRSGDKRVHTKAKGKVAGLRRDLDVRAERSSSGREEKGVTGHVQIYTTDLRARVDDVQRTDRKSVV